MESKKVRLSLSIRPSYGRFTKQQIGWKAVWVSGYGTRYRGVLRATEQEAADAAYAWFDRICEKSKDAVYEDVTRSTRSWNRKNAEVKP